MIPLDEVHSWHKWTRCVASKYSCGNDRTRDDLQSAAMLALVQIWPRLPEEPSRQRPFIIRRLMGAILDELRRIVPQAAARRRAKRRARYHGVALSESDKAYASIETTSLEDLREELADPGCLQDELLGQAEARALVEQVCKQLRPRTQQIIEQLLNDPDATLLGIGARYRVSESRAAQVRKEAIRQVQDLLQLRMRLLKTPPPQTSAAAAPSPARKGPRPGHRRARHSAGAANHGCSDPR